MKIFKKLFALAMAAVTAAVCLTTTAFAEEADFSVNNADVDEVIYADVYNAPIVNIDTSSFEEVYLGSSARAVDLPYSSSILFGANTTEAYTPVFNTSFPSNEYGLLIYLTNIKGSNTVKVKVYAHFKGEDATAYHEAVNANYAFSSKPKQISFKTAATSIDKLYISFGGGTSGYATEFDYKITIDKIIN